MRQQLGLD